MNIFLLIILLSFFVISNCQYKIPRRGLAVINGNYNESKISGHVMFKQLGPFLLQISVKIHGIPPNLGPKLGFHVHKNGILNPSENVTQRCQSAGPHYNPFHYLHGNITSRCRHMGDYGNVIVNKNGTISQTFTDRISTLLGPFSILGRTIVLHEKEDDLGLNPDKNSKLNGNSGPPIACGVIGVWS
ncbi:unnamed protein product [Brachionus calyciflorus]|uniref:Superoxide dismutase copper/zinc binding domain-containing protein n=1 Tax=Brachionus calyciflorus TaxID=104777 RepID=A0A813NH38_9BILA|nr:unnamed protein product [Brachionus calyciflorus]